VVGLFDPTDQSMVIDLGNPSLPHFASRMVWKADNEKHFDLGAIITANILEILFSTRIILLRLIWFRCIVL
jgi:hypothetical protein